MGTRAYKIVKESRDKILIFFTAIIIIFISFDLYREALSYINILYPKDDIATNDSINPIIYRVQFVASFKRQLNKDSLSKDYNINKEIREDYHYEWYKYSIGYFDDFPQAKIFRDSLAKNNLFQGSFIVCFRNNQRLDKLVILKKYKPKTAKTIRYAAKASQIEFKIQIYASYNKRLSIDSLANVFNINQNVREDFLNGYYKYSTGSFDNFNKAKNYLTELKTNSKLADAFIVAYKDNQRLDNIAKAFKRKPKTITSKQEEQNVEVKVEKIKPVKEKKQVEPFYSNIPVKPKRKLSKKELAENNLRIADSLRTDSFNRVVTLRDSLKRDSIRFFYYLEAKVDSIRSTIITTPQPDYSYVTLVMLSFAKKYNTKVYNIMSAAYERRSPTDRLIIILFFLIHFFALNFFLVSVISVFILIFKRIRDKKAKVLADKYRDILAEYIFYDELESSIPDELKSVNSKFKINVLIDQILIFNKNLHGETKTKLRDLYLNLNLSKYSINYTKSRRWHIKAKGFRQMAQMNITEANQIIEKSLNSKNDILNGEAQLSLVQLNSETPFSFLSRLRNFFPLWNQINVHNLLTISNITIPQFSNWLSSDNSTIVTFALRMIRYFQQQKSVNEIIGLLKHSDESVRAEAIKTLSKLGIGDALVSLKNSYEMETDRNKILIIKALQSIPDESNLKFLGELLRDIDNNVKLEAAKAIVALGPIGTSKLMMTKMTAQMENIELIPLINHALDNRIE